MKVQVKNKLSCLLLVALFFTQSLAYARPLTFQHIQLNHGISVDIPSHWLILSSDIKKNVTTAADAMLSNADIEPEEGVKKTLLAVNSTPNPTGAMIRVGILSHQYWTQAKLESASEEELREVQTAMIDVFKRLEASGTKILIEMQPVRVEKLNGVNVLVTSYIRESKFGPPWQVTQYKIPVKNRLIEFTLSYRLADDIIWKPILEYVKRSIRF